MALTTAQTTALAAELNSDPRGYGYAALITAGNDGALADKLNLVRDGSAGTVPTTPLASGGIASGVITINRGTITTQNLVESIVQSEMPSNASQRDWLLMVCAGTTVRVDTNSTARAGLLAIFTLAAAPTTRANLIAIATRSGSRAEELLGTGAGIVFTDVATALRG